MPVKLRNSKERQHRITPAAIAAFRTAMATRDTRRNCDRRKGTCLSPSVSERCPTCTEHSDAWLTLHRALGLRPWQVSPVDADTPEPPGWCAPHHDWPMARELRLALEEAAR